jgi:hypothetical protein
VHLTALAAEVRFSILAGRSHPSPQLRSAQTIGKSLSVIHTTQKQTAPINRSNLIFFAKAPSKAINKVHRQKGGSSADLNSPDAFSYPKSHERKSYP